MTTTTTTTMEKTAFFPTTGRTVTFELVGNDYEDLINRGKNGEPRFEIPEKGQWPAKIRALQDSITVDADGRRFATATDESLHQGCVWWTRGTDGRCGVGGWQRQFPFASVRAYFETRGATFPTVAALFENLPDDEPDDAGAETDPPMTSTEVANVLGTTPQRVVALAKAGAIDFERTGTGIYIFRRSEVERFAAEQWPSIRSARTVVKEAGDGKS